MTVFKSKSTLSCFKCTGRVNLIVAAQTRLKPHFINSLVPFATHYQHVARVIDISPMTVLALKQLGV